MNKMNQDKLIKMAAQVRIGGAARRKKKVVRRSSTTDDKKLQSSLKKLSVNNISGIEEVNMIKDDGSVIHFNNPKVQASLNANTFAISGHADNKQITEMLPGILNHLGSEGFNQLKKLASSVSAGTNAGVGLDDEDDVPELVEDFEEASKKDTEAKASNEEGKENQPVKSKKSRRKKKKNAAKSENTEDSGLDAASPTEKDDADADDEAEDLTNDRKQKKEKLREKNSESKAE